IKSNPNKSFLIICNTIKQSQEIAASINTGEDVEESVIYLSSSILPIRRVQIIQKIKAGIKYNQRQIIVATQVVEAGVDIDLDIVYRDFAPLDSINQSAGRCNRNGGKSRGTVKLFNSDKAKYIYDATLLDITQRVLNEFSRIILEKEFYKLNQRYFTEVRNAVSDQSPIANQLLLYMRTLQLEKLDKEFELIKQERRHYDVFVPFEPAAEALWIEYTGLQRAKGDRWERKRAIKRLRPKLLQYVTRFPRDKNYEPDPKDKDKPLILVNDWQKYYDLEYGFKLEKDEPQSAFF
ncbi:MAG: helicase-related protein, partial [Saprospiraceae bacterium]